IPTLQTVNTEGTTTQAMSNEDKSKIFARSLFLPPPPQSTIPEGFNYPKPADQWTNITSYQLLQAIKKLSLYKAPGPDRVANIVFQ
ncbi:hypothetical protein J3A83DRAFT_4107271, partial [Scleroderma citrinum]